MENLKYPKEHFLINDPTAEDVVSVNQNSTLLFPKFGLSFNGGEDRLEVMYSGNGHSNGVFLALNETATVKDGETFSFGFAVRRKERLPGIRNAYPEPNMNGRPYYSEIKSLNVTSGIIDAADQELILSKLLKIVDADKNNPESKFFDIKKGYYVSVNSSTNTASVNVKFNGGTTTYDNGSNHTAKDLANAINAGGDVIAMTVSSTMLLILSKNPAENFIVEAGANTTVVKKGLAVYGKSIETKVVTTVDDSFMTPELFTLIVLNYAGVSSSADGSFTINYSGYQAVMSNTSEGTAANSIVSHNKGLYAYGYNGLLYIVNKYGYTGTAKATSVILGYTSTLQYVENALNGGVFPMATSDDIFREQAGIYNGMGAAVRQEQALADEEYVVLNFIKGGISPALSSGASSYEHYETRYSIAVNKSSLKRLKWNSTFDGAGTSRSFVQVIQNVFPSAMFI